MIETGFGYVALLILLASSIVYLPKYFHLKLFDYLPAIVILYFTVMLFATFGVWEKNEEITSAYKSFKSNLLPAMIFLMLLQADLRKIAGLGAKMLAAFFLTSLSIALGFIVMFSALHTYFEPDAWKAFAALSGSWIGGSANMIAIQGALNVPDSKMGYALLIDSIDYAIWVMILLALVPAAARFNRWSGADSSLIDRVSARLERDQSKNTMSFESLFLLLGVSIALSASSQYFAEYLPTGTAMSKETWIVLIATIAGVVGAMTPLGKIAGAQTLGNILLYIIIALIASRANFGELTQAPLYIAAGFAVIALHASIMVLLAKLFKFDLFTLGVASLANIGGVASAPILAGAYSQALIPVGVLMAMMGYIIGTFGGLAVGQVLALIAQ